MTDDIKVVCTDKARHRETWISVFRWDSGWFEAHRYVVEPPGFDEYPHSRLPVEHHLVSVQPPDTGPDARRCATGRLYRFKCRKCRRTPEISVDTLITLLDGLRAAGAQVLDMSRLPF